MCPHPNTNRWPKLRTWCKQSSIAALKSRILTSHLVKECSDNLRLCRERYHINLEWVRGHDDDTGNEAADAAAKEASETPWIGQHPWGPVPLSWIKGRIEVIMEREWAREWEARKDCRQSKTMLGKPLRKTWQEDTND
jgi:hypothetical protein